MSHYLGAAGEHLVASFFLSEGHPVYWPAVPGWVDLVVQTPFGFNRVQVKTTGDNGKTARVRRLGSTNDLAASDRYDVLAVVNQHRLWIIPASLLGTKDDITLHTTDDNCPFAGHRKR